MRKFDVHWYFVVRAKIAGVIANDHKSAIAAVEADRDIHNQMTRHVSLDRPGERLSSIDYSEETTSYLVDVVGDTEYEESISFDCARNGALVEIHCEPGQGVELSRFHHAALHDYADGDCRDALAKSKDVFALNLALQECSDPLATFIANELSGLAGHQKEEALSRLEQAIAELQTAYAAVATLPDEEPKIANTLTAFHADHTDIRIPVIADGKHIGHFYRERFAGRKWADSILELHDGTRIRSLTESVPFLKKRFGIAPELTIQTHEDYYTIYDDAGVPFSRVMVGNGVFSMRELMSGISQKFNSLAPALAAARVALNR